MTAPLAEMLENMIYFVSRKSYTVPLLEQGQGHLRAIVAIGSYIKISLRFWYYASLSVCCQNLEKQIGRQNFRESFKVSGREKGQF